jgi:pre-mRNA-processing factor SLU7
MSFVLNMPPSVVVKKMKEEENEGGGGTDEGPPGKKREDWKKLKELEEARKAGTAPAMKDEEGK